MDAATYNLWQMLAGLESEYQLAVVVLLIVFGTAALVFTVGIVSLTVRSMHKHRLEDSLKRELVERGMSAEEIERIVGAGVRKLVGPNAAPSRS